jgi:hypothetical protein
MEMTPPATCLYEYRPPSIAAESTMEKGMAAQSSNVTLVNEVY